MAVTNLFYTIVIISIVAAFCILVLVNKRTRIRRPQHSASSLAAEKHTPIDSTVAPFPKSSATREEPSCGSIRFENYDLQLDIDKLSPLSNDIVIDSTTSGEHYIVNISKLICSYPDFIKMRSQIAHKSPSRLCKHLVRAIGDNWKDAASAFVDPVSQLEVRNYIEYKRGFPYEILAKKGVFQNAVFYIVYNRTDWLNIYYPDNRQVLNRYGFSIAEKRWSYEKNPFPSGLRREANNSIFSLSKELIERIGKLEPRTATSDDHSEISGKPMQLPSLVSQITQVGYETPELMNFGDSRFFQRHEYIHEILNQFGKSNSNINALLAITGNPAIYVRYGWTELRRFMIVDGNWQYNDRPPNYKNIEEWLQREWQSIKPVTSHITHTVIGKRRLIAHFSESNANVINVFINDWPQHSYNPLNDEWNTAYRRTKNQDAENWLRQEWKQWTAGKQVSD